MLAVKEQVIVADDGPDMVRPDVARSRGVVVFGLAQSEQMAFPVDDAYHIPFLEGAFYSDDTYR